MKTRRFVDRVTIRVRAGRGGDGVVSFRREAHVPRGGPDGGDGGQGGHVILRGDRHESSLLRLFFLPELRAADGEPGRGRQMHGRDAPHLVARVPCGTMVYDADSGELLADIVEDGQEAVVAAGGRGGSGNVHWKSSVNQAPLEFTPGETGQECRLRLELKLIAEAGLVGFPNAGKSSLLAAVSAARPRIAAYPFTTLNPQIGTVVYPDCSRLRIAEIPGLIGGAHAGAGLGADFLRHLSRARVLVYVVDAAGVDGRTPWDDYRALRREIGFHDASLLARPSLLVANKTDLPAAAANLPLLERKARRRVIPVSAADGEGVPALLAALKALVKPAVPGAPAAPGPSSRRRAGALSRPRAEALAEAEEVTPEKLRRAVFLDLGGRRRR